MKSIRVRSKVWLEVDGEPLLGDGRYRLLRAVERSGSINGAARELGISYRKARAQLAALEAHAPLFFTSTSLEKQGLPVVGCLIVTGR